jgi:transketolase
VEQLAALRAIPGLTVLRPSDANETVEAWKCAISQRNGPTALILTRQALPILDRSIFAPASELRRGAYVLADIGDKAPELLLMASGSEVSLIVAAGTLLGAEGVNVRMVSFPAWELFAAQEQEYREAVLPPSLRARLAVEAGIAQGWERWVGDGGAILSLEHYGASAPAKILFEKFGFTVENIVAKARELLR